jgi:general secretion pathway protein J
MLVAMSIFAVIGIAGLGILDTVLRTNDRTEGRLERLAEIDRALLILRRDLAQLDAAPVTLTDDTLSFQRAGADRPVGIRFALDQNGTLTRNLADTTGEPVAQTLLTEVSTADWRLMDGARRWQDNWPPGDDPAVPIAAELTLTLRLPMVSDPVSVTRLIALPEGARR